MATDDPDLDAVKADLDAIRDRLDRIESRLDFQHDDLGAVRNAILLYIDAQGPTRTAELVAVVADRMDASPERVKDALHAIEQEGTLYQPPARDDTGRWRRP